MRFTPIIGLCLLLVSHVPVISSSRGPTKSRKRLDDSHMTPSHADVETSQNGRSKNTVSIRSCPPIRFEQGSMIVTLLTGPQRIQSSRVVVDCETRASSHSGTDYLSSHQLRDCPGPHSVFAQSFASRVALICTPDQTYKRFVKDNLNLSNTKPVRIAHLRVVNDTASPDIAEIRVIRRRFENDDLRLVSSTDPSVYVDMNPVRYSRNPSIEFVNERLSSVQDRIVSPSVVDVREIAVSPILYEYVRASLHDGARHLIQVRSYQDGRIIAGFRRKLSQHELSVRTNITETGGIRHIHTESIDPDGVCCFCDELKQQEINTTLVKLCCFHEYHETCIRRWIFEHQKSECPECRSQIF